MSKFEPVIVGFLCNWCSYTGADGVLVAGCHPGDCHYQEGNYKAMRRMELLKRMLDQFGIEPERFRLAWISASEANEFVHVVNEMTEQIRALGPLKLGHFEDAAPAAEKTTSAETAAAPA
jgi:F420-non-reducing hydrogenase iron-sulfur subunit